MLITSKDLNDKPCDNYRDGIYDYLWKDTELQFDPIETILRSRKQFSETTVIFEVMWFARSCTAKMDEAALRYCIEAHKTARFFRLETFLYLYDADFLIQQFADDSMKLVEVLEELVPKSYSEYFHPQCVSNILRAVPFTSGAIARLMLRTTEHQQTQFLMQLPYHVYNQLLENEIWMGNMEKVYDLWKVEKSLKDRV